MNCLRFDGGRGRSPFGGLERNAFLYEMPVLNLCNLVWADAINDEARRRGLSIPDDQYLRGGRARSLARSAFSDRLPPQIVEESRKGLQAGDWYVGFCAAQIDAREQVERLAGLAPAQRIFDIERMRGLAAQMPTDGWHSSRVMGAYRLGLLRAISAGHFLRNALGAN